VGAKVVLSGLFYPMAIVRYFQNALIHLQNEGLIELFVVGPYTGRQIPWAGGMLIDCPLPAPDLTLPMTSQVSAQVVQQRIPFKPDLWIHVDAAYSLHHRPDCQYVVVGTDPHCVDYDHARKVADRFYNMQTPYMKTGDHWLPYAYDVRYHSPLANALNYDFGIVGADSRQGPLYDNRNRLVQRLQKAGYHVLQIFGKVYDDYRNLLTQCKVGLNWSTRLDTTARVFETMGMQVALLTNRTPDLAKLGFRDKVEYAGFDDMNEAEGMAEWLMTDENWIEMGALGRQAVASVGHSWDNRVEHIFLEAGINVYA